MARFKLPMIVQSGVRQPGDAPLTGLSTAFYAVPRYDFAEHGGAVGTIGTGVFIPAGAVLFQRLHVNISALTSAGTPVVKFTLNDADNDTLSGDRFGGSNYGYGGLPAGPFTNSASREIKVVIQDAALTAGVEDCYVFFIMPPS